MLDWRKIQLLKIQKSANRRLRVHRIANRLEVAKSF
jgi:hypothetical protein